MTDDRGTYVAAMEETRDAEDGVERTLRLLRGLAEQGIVPLSVEVGEYNVKVQVATVLRDPAEDGNDAPSGARSYVGRALAGRKVG